MDCPKGCGELQLYESRTMVRKYVCTNKGCNVRLEMNTETGEIVQIASGIAAIGAVVGAVVSFLLGGRSDDSGS